MKRLLVTFIVCILWNPQLINAQSIIVETADGGSVVTELGYDIKLNKNSTLHRSWVVLNDPTCPVQLYEAGINTRYGDREYNYVQVGTAETSESITALEVRYLLYDVFGEHMQTLSATKITELSANGSLALEDIGAWRAWENDVSNLLTVVAFVAQVRTGDGKIWRYQDKKIGEELNKIQLKVTIGTLDPSKEK